MKFKFFLVFLLSIPSIVLANYKISIFTDDPTKKKSEEVIRYFKTNPPFNKFQITFDVIFMDSKKLACRPHPTITRVIYCNTGKVAKLASQAGSDQAFIVSKMKGYGGSGGNVPIITSSKKTPVSMIVHEYLHTIGFGDEYAFSQHEAYQYCKRYILEKYINLTVIKPLKNYPDDQFAKSKHKKNIPWFFDIKNETKISNKKLGSPKVYNREIGLFSAKTCNKYSPKIHVWRPGKKTIMSNLKNDIGALTPIVEKALLSAGMKKKNFMQLINTQSNMTPIDAHYNDGQTQCHKLKKADELDFLYENIIKIKSKSTNPD